jgi:hypothetical protein
MSFLLFGAASNTSSYSSLSNLHVILVMERTLDSGYTLGVVNLWFLFLTSLFTFIICFNQQWTTIFLTPKWAIPQCILNAYPQLHELTDKVTIPFVAKDDSLFWKQSHDGNLSLKDAYSYHWAPSQNVPFGLKSFGIRLFLPQNPC